MTIEFEGSAPSFQVRKVSKAQWTYDLYNLYPGAPPEYSVGECRSKKQATQNARAIIAKAEDRR